MKSCYFCEKIIRDNEYYTYLTVNGRLKRFHAKCFSKYEQKGILLKEIKGE